VEFFSKILVAGKFCLKNAVLDQTRYLGKVDKMFSYSILMAPTRYFAFVFHVITSISQTMAKNRQTCLLFIAKNICHVCFKLLIFRCLKSFFLELIKTSKLMNFDAIWNYFDTIYKIRWTTTRLKYIIRIKLCEKIKNNLIYLGVVFVLFTSNFFFVAACIVVKIVMSLKSNR